MAYTTADLLSSIKKRAFIPETQDTFDDEDLLAMATEELRDFVLPLIKRTREEYYLTHKDFTITDSTQFVRIPDRALGIALREVSFVSGGNEYNLSRKTVEDKIHSDNSGPISSFYIEGSRIYLLGTGNGTLRLYYYNRPGRLVETSDAAQITEINTDTGAITVSSVPSDWSATSTIDFIRAGEGFEYLGTDISSTIVGTTITVAVADLPSELAAGDWIALQDTSPIPQLPPEFFSILAQSVAVQIFESQGDFEAKKSGEAKLARMEKSILDVISPRVEGEPKVFVKNKYKSAFLGFWRR